MSLNFEIQRELGTGDNPVMVHLANHKAYMFYLVNGALKVRELNLDNDPLDLYNWADSPIYAEENAGVDQDITKLRQHYLSGAGSWITYENNGRLAIAPFPFTPEHLYFTKVNAKFQDPLYPQPGWYKHEGKWRKIVNTWEKIDGKYFLMDSNFKGEVE